MTHYTTFGKRALFVIASIALFITTNNSIAQIAPDLGTAAAFTVFTGAGAVGNDGPTIVNGDIGTHAGAFTGFPPGVYTGTEHVADAVSVTAKADVEDAYADLLTQTVDEVLPVATMGNGQILTSHVYGRSDLTTITGELTFDAEGDPDAIFIVKINAALSVAANTRILLVGGAQACNIYWQVNGAVSIATFSFFKGTILANGAISLAFSVWLDGRALTQAGAISLDRNVITVPCGTNQVGLDQILPVELTSFDLASRRGKVFLDWRTGSEVRNAGFEVYRSDASGSNFRIIASYLSNSELVGLGTTSQGKNYSFTDGGTLKLGDLYQYRLVDVSLDGGRTQHPAKGIRVEADEAPGTVTFLKVYPVVPNPAADEVSVNFSLPEADVVTLAIYSVDGQLLGTPIEHRNYAAGGHVAIISTTGLAAGTYILQFSVSKHTRSMQLVIAR